MKIRHLAIGAAALAALVNIGGAAFAQTKVFVINEQRIRAETKLGKALDQALNELANQGVDKLGLKTLKTELESEAAALKPQTQALTKEALDANPTLKARVEGLNKKTADYMQRSNALNQTVEQQDNGYNAAFTYVMAPAIEAVAKEAGADIVVSYASTWYTKPAVDLSKKVIDRLDATVPTLDALKAALPKPKTPPAGAAPAAPAAPAPAPGQ